MSSTRVVLRRLTHDILVAILTSENPENPRRRRYLNARDGGDHGAEGDLGPEPVPRSGVEHHQLGGQELLERPAASEPPAAGDDVEVDLGAASSFRSGHIHQVDKTNLGGPVPCKHGVDGFRELCGA